MSNAVEPALLMESWPAPIPRLPGSRSGRTAAVVREMSRWDTIRHWPLWPGEGPTTLEATSRLRIRALCVYLHWTLFSAACVFWSWTSAAEIPSAASPRVVESGIVSTAWRYLS
jgi:hypothetical protein